MRIDGSELYRKTFRAGSPWGSAECDASPHTVVLQKISHRRTQIRPHHLVQQLLLKYHLGLGYQIKWWYYCQATFFRGTSNFQIYHKCLHNIMFFASWRNKLVQVYCIECQTRQITLPARIILSKVVEWIHPYNSAEIDEKAVVIPSLDVTMFGYAVLQFTNQVIKELTRRVVLGSNYIEECKIPVRNGRMNLYECQIIYTNSRAIHTPPNVNTWVVRFDGQGNYGHSHFPLVISRIIVGYVL